MVFNILEVIMSSKVSLEMPGKVSSEMFRRKILERWRNRNLYYYKDLEKFFIFSTISQSSVLEIGSGSGHLLKAVDPSYGFGIDENPLAIENSRERFPDLKFMEQQVEDFQPPKKFEYILMANTISYIEDIQKSLHSTKKACQANSRLVMTFHNPAWEPILKFATFIGQRMPLLNLNWLSLEDVENLLNLAGFEVIYHGKRLIFPKRVPLISYFLNRVLAPLPIINKFCLCEYVIARLRPQEADIQAQIRQKTCSVIIPARNEAGNIEACVTRMPNLGHHTEIIFIEGHSKDNTWEEIQRVQKKYGDRWDIKIAQQSGKGKGDAVRQGFDLASGDVFIILDSDLTVKPEDLVYFFEAIASGQCEFANGCRLIYPLSDTTMPWLNRMANRFFAWLLSYLLNTKIKDSLCGTKAISKENYQRIAENRSYFGDFDPFGDFDLLFGSAKLRLKINDIPVRYMPRTYGSSNIQHFKEGLVLLKMCSYAAKKIKFI
jgi:SAM-dependent methyltransferase